MSKKQPTFNQKQLAFQELFIGSGIYAVILGFFNDYTSIVYAQSFSTILYASIVLEVLTYGAFQLKGGIVGWLKDRNGTVYRVLMFLCIWLVMFLSKFIFIWVLDVLFGSYIRVNGFFGILMVVLCVTVVHRLAFLVFRKLGRP